MKKLLLLSALLLGWDVAQAQKDILGEWITTDGKAKVWIYRNGDEGNEYYGILVGAQNGFGAREEAITAAHNGIAWASDKEAGVYHVLEGFDYTGNNTWEYGRLNNGGKSYHCVLHLKNPQELEIKIYKSALPFHRTLRWKKAAPTNHPYQP